MKRPSTRLCHTAMPRFPNRVQQSSFALCNGFLVVGWGSGVGMGQAEDSILAFPESWASVCEPPLALAHNPEHSVGQVPCESVTPC